VGAVIDWRSPEPTQTSLKKTNSNEQQRLTMNSIAARLFIVASLVLATFVIVTSLAVRHSVHKRAEDALFSRMQGMIYGILGAAELVDESTLAVNEGELPEQRLLSSVNGIYAEVRDSGNRVVWASKSSVSSIPEKVKAPVGTWRYLHRNENTSEEVRALQFQAIYVAESGAEPLFTIQVVEDAEVFASDLSRFDRNLWFTLLLAALLLLLVLAAVLIWGLKPLRDIGKDLSRIERGDAERLDTSLPRELRPLASSINTLLASERNRQSRYRNVMDDLAHSLKTPLSILRNITSGSAGSGTNANSSNTADSNGERSHDTAEIKTQTERMQDIITYHLQRAQAGGSQALAPSISPSSIIKRIGDSLQKAYPSSEPTLGQKIEFISELEEDFQLKVTESDLFEILGNLLENACKYGANKVVVKGTSDDASAQLTVSDNGQGFPETAMQELLTRGRRADTQQEGQGLGLAFTTELVESYGGHLSLANNEQGGARVMLNFPL